MPIYNDDVFKELQSVPEPSNALQELSERARAGSEARFFLAMLDLDREMWNGKKFVQITYLRGWVIQEFAQFMAWVDFDLTTLQPNEQLLGRRLQMAVYSQFWECLGVQRLLLSLARIACGNRYDPRLLLDRNVKPDSYAVYRLIRSEASGESLQIAPLLKGIYRNQIRNAFAHSELFFGGDSGWISFLNCDNRKSYHIPSIKHETWDLMYDRTRSFIIEFFRMRQAGISEFRARLPYTFLLPEFDGAFTVVSDPRGGFNFQR